MESFNQSTLRRIFYLLGLFLVLSCEGAIEEPDHLISKSDMSVIMKDLVLNDQSSLVNISADLSEGTRFILKKHKVSAKDFMDSYKYYVVKNKMDGILEDAQEMLVEEEPRLKKQTPTNTGLVK